MGCTSCGGNNTHTQASYSGSGSTRVLHHSTETCDDCGFAQKINKTVVGKWTELPLYNQPAILDDLDVIVGSNEEGRAWRLPVSRVLSGGSLNKLTNVIDKQTADITVPAGQVVPIFKPSANEVVEKAVAADYDHQAHYVAFANNPNDVNMLDIQASGFLTFPRTHSYQVGKVYYLHQSQPGQVTAVRPSSGIVQPLFAVQDELTLRLDVRLV